MKILDLSKFHMYDIWYNLLKPIFRDALALTLIETDLFVYFIIKINEKTYNEIILSNPKKRNNLNFNKFQQNYLLYQKNNKSCGKLK